MRPGARLVWRAGAIVAGWHAGTPHDAALPLLLIDIDGVISLWAGTRRGPWTAAGRLEDGEPHFLDRARRRLILKAVLSVLVRGDDRLGGHHAVRRRGESGHSACCGAEPVTGATASSTASGAGSCGSSGIS